ncbi:MAG: hypothetical protein Q9182_002908 [Xanthomendoza sp. 2 TL-2023]
MVVPSRIQYIQASDATSNKKSASKSDTMYGNPLVHPTFPDLGQMWPVTQAWNNIPLANYDFDLPFQQDYSKNNSLVQNQQNENPDYDGNDDFYDNEPSKRNDLMNMPAESAGNSDSAPSQIKVTTPKKAIVNTAKASATDTKKSAAELRAFLLAKKQPGSATPSASLTSNKDNNDVNVMDSRRNGKKAEQPKPPLSGEMMARRGQTTASVSTDKSLQNSSNAQSLPTQNADIQGLIDECRASETFKDSTVPGVSTVALEIVSNGKTNGGKNPNASKPIATVEPIKSLTEHAGSPGSPESGEIHSDQEPAIKPTRLNKANKNAKKINNEPSKGAEKKITVGNSDQHQTPKTPQIRAEASKQAAIQTQSRQGSLFQTTDQRKSTRPTVDPRNVSLVQKINRTQQDIQSPSLRGTHGDDTHRFDSDVRVDKRDHQHPAKASSSTMQPRLPVRTTTDERLDHDKHERKKNEELAALYKRQLAEQITPSPKTNDNRRLLNELTNRSEIHRPADDTPSKPGDHHELHSTASGAVSNGLGSQSLTQLQYEQIQKLGIDMSPQGLSELYDFLEYHRFYVDQYREGFFARQRRLKALDAEKEALELEALRQFDHFNSIRAQSLAARERTEPATPVLVTRNTSVDTPPVRPMPPPLTLPKRNSNGGVIAISGTDLPDSTVSATSSTNRTNGAITPRDAPQSSWPSRKRDQPHDEMDLDSSRKVARIDSDLRSNGKGPEISPMTQVTYARQVSSDYRPSNYDTRGRSRSPTTRRRSFSPRGRALDFGHSTSRDYGYWSDREYANRRQSADGLRRNSASTLCQNCNRAGHFTTDCREERRDSRSRYTSSRSFGPLDNEESHGQKEPMYSTYNHSSFSNRGYRGGYRGGRANYQNSKPHTGPSSYPISPVTSGRKNSDPLNLKAGGQSRSTSSGLDLP